MLHSEERGRESLPHPLRASFTPDDDGEAAMVEDGGQTGPQVQAGPGDCTTPVLEKGCGSAHGDAPCGTARKRVISQMCSDFGFEAGLTKKRKTHAAVDTVDESDQAASSQRAGLGRRIGISDEPTPSPAAPEAIDPRLTEIVDDVKAAIAAARESEARPLRAQLQEALADLEIVRRHRDELSGKMAHLRRLNECLGEFFRAWMSDKPAPHPMKREAVKTLWEEYSSGAVKSMLDETLEAVFGRASGHPGTEFIDGRAALTGPGWVLHQYSDSSISFTRGNVPR